MNNIESERTDHCSLRDEKLEKASGGTNLLISEDEHYCGKIKAGIGVKCGGCGLVANLLTESGQRVHWICCCGRKNVVDIE